MKEIAICIQIRDGNTRLPGKGSMPLEGHPIYMHLIRNVGRCLNFINKHSDKKRLVAKCYFLVPFDEIYYWEEVCDREIKLFDVQVIPGHVSDNYDVFYRFNEVFKNYKPSYIARITGDCPFIPSALINKAINCATTHKLDYISNVDERYRTMPDGFDIEVLSDEAFLWLSQNIYKGYKSDLEHVTTYLRRETPDWMRCATITAAFDTSDYKYSIDTQADFANVSTRYRDKKFKDDLARKDGLGTYEY